MKKQLTAALCALCLTTSLCLPAQAATFTDMPQDWSTQALTAAADNGLLQGDNGKIQPDALLTRAQMAAIVNRMVGAKTAADLSAYTDVSATAWYYADMAKAVSVGTFRGDGSGKLRPADAITREEAMTVLARTAALNDGAASDLAAFSDVSAVSSWAVGPVASMIKAGYVQGAAGKIAPKANITRKEFAVIISRMVDQYVVATADQPVITGTNVMINSAPTALTLRGNVIAGDLYLGDGLDGCTITLQDVTVTGRIVVRGGATVNLNGTTSAAALIQQNTKTVINAAESSCIGASGSGGSGSSGGSGGSGSSGGSAGVTSANTLSRAVFKIRIAATGEIKTVEVAASSNGTALYVDLSSYADEDEVLSGTLYAKNAGNFVFLNKESELGKETSVKTLLGMAGASPTDTATVKTLRRYVDDWDNFFPDSMTPTADKIAIAAGTITAYATITNDNQLVSLTLKTN